MDGMTGRKDGSFKVAEALALVLITKTKVRSYYVQVNKTDKKKKLETLRKSNVHFYFEVVLPRREGQSEKADSVWIRGSSLFLILHQYFDYDILCCCLQTSMFVVTDTVQLPCEVKYSYFLVYSTAVLFWLLKINCSYIFNCVLSGHKKASQRDNGVLKYTYSVLMYNISERER